MKVKEFITILSQLPEDTEVFYFRNDGYGDETLLPIEDRRIEIETVYELPNYFTNYLTSWEESSSSVKKIKAIIF